MVVFIDGNYQCNRNLVGLQPPQRNMSKEYSEIDFTVRQKEKPMGDGMYIGHEWRFDDHNIGSSLLHLRSTTISNSVRSSQPS
jgi:hypothetical protein